MYLSNHEQLLSFSIVFPSLYSESSWSFPFSVECSRTHECDLVFLVLRFTCGLHLQVKFDSDILTSCWVFMIWPINCCEGVCPSSAHHNCFVWFYGLFGVPELTVCCMHVLLAVTALFASYWWLTTSQMQRRNRVLQWMNAVNKAASDNRKARRAVLWSTWSWGGTRDHQMNFDLISWTDLFCHSSISDSEISQTTQVKQSIWFKRWIQALKSTHTLQHFQIYICNV